MKNIPIIEHIVITDVAPQRLAYLRSQDNQLHYRQTIIDIRRRIAANMPVLQAA